MVSTLVNRGTLTASWEVSRKEPATSELAFSWRPNGVAQRPPCQISRLPTGSTQVFLKGREQGSRRSSILSHLHHTPLQEPRHPWNQELFLTSRFGVFSQLKMDTQNQEGSEKYTRWTGVLCVPESGLGASLSISSSLTPQVWFSFGLAYPLPWVLSQVLQCFSEQVPSFFIMWSLAHLVSMHHIDFYFSIH